MRSFIVLSVVFAVSFAAPQYNYESGNGLLSGLSPSGGSALLSGQIPSGQGGEKYLPPGQPSQAPLINKKFYIVSAPEDNSNDNKNKHLVLGRPQKNYRVIFIKAPVGDNNNVKYSAEFAPQEEKTVIYVLSKKDNELNAGDIATPAPTTPSKPEIYFIKYKTDEEAQHAQKEIQGEYDKLGGTSEVSDQGIAPVHSVVGSLNGLNPDGSYNYQQTNSGSANAAQPLNAPSAPNPNYLPANLKF